MRRSIKALGQETAVPTADVSFAFRPLREDNLTLLHHWLHRPHVTYWWGGEDETFEDTRQTYLPRLKEGSSIKSYVAVVAGEPIGFIQSYVALGSADGWWQEETDPGVRGIDQFLIEGSMLGQGIGSRMVGQFVRLLFEDAAVTRVQTDPDPPTRVLFVAMRRRASMQSGRSLHRMVRRC